MIKVNTITGSARLQGTLPAENEGHQKSNRHLTCMQASPEWSFNFKGSTGLGNRREIEEQSEEQPGREDRRRARGQESGAPLPSHTLLMQR